MNNSYNSLINFAMEGAGPAEGERKPKEATGEVNLLFIIETTFPTDSNLRMIWKASSAGEKESQDASLKKEELPCRA
jgi:hypothetical protein